MRHVNISLTQEDYDSLCTMARKVGAQPTTMARALVLTELSGVNPVALAQSERRATAFFVAILERILGLAARQNGITGDDARLAAQGMAAQIVEEIEATLEADHD